MPTPFKHGKEPLRLQKLPLEVAHARLGRVLKAPYLHLVFHIAPGSLQSGRRQPFLARKGDQPGCLMPGGTFQNAAGFAHSFFQDAASFYIHQGCCFRAHSGIQTELLAKVIRLHIGCQAHRS